VPACSVVVPCFNDADRLVEALDSLVSQTYSDWEAIVVDDASTIGHVEAVVGAASDPRVRVVRHAENRGLAAARNTGIRAAAAPLVLPLDSDDRLAPSFLDRLIGVLDTEPDTDCVFSDFRLFGEVDGIQRFAVGDLRTLLIRQWLPGPGCLYRRTLWERVGGYCEAPELRAGNEDWDFYVAAAKAGFRASHVAEPLYEYRVDRTSMSNRLQYTNHVTREFIYSRHRAVYDAASLGPMFLAEGYRASAQASNVRNERRRALRLALHSLRLEPRSRSALAIIARAMVPARAARLLRATRGRLTR
jgi:glycosyltransferase involved in cell wall biosynthesis